MKKKKRINTILHFIIYISLSWSFCKAVGQSDDLCITVSLCMENSAPGPDGIPFCLYARCPLLQALLVKVIQASISTGRFPVSWSHTLIHPILKPGKNAFLPASYRPIALLCTDYKIFTTILSSRMKSFLPDLFPQHQTGYIRRLVNPPCCTKIRPPASYHKRRFPPPVG